MTALKQPELVRISDYLEAERHSPVKHEYVDGHVYAMTGTSKVHNLIVGNLAGLLRDHLRSGPCQVYTSDIKVQAGIMCWCRRITGKFRSIAALVRKVGGSFISWRTHWG